MTRTLTTTFTRLSLVVFALACPACGDESSAAETIAVTIDSQDNIVSENGPLELLRGALSIQSVSLVGGPEEVTLIGPVTVDLSIRDQVLPLRSSVPAGSYSGLRIELAPQPTGTNMLDVDLRSVMTEETVRAISKLDMSGNADFPDGARTITEASTIELHLLLRGMFFYLAPLSDAVDGVYEAGEDQRDFLTMDLVGMFDLRVLQ